ncbi:uncharacterized protein THITE_2108450 [Thermothielavioides terrestris NRRL 8126]|uniref:Uncharacterized protein n=1 Tax=Thermothielavioides terrestris (strain ATCC 38088 / NRRL 8126) TaxID=578455 RepID=G2QR90_THETT|nr:uncharacterized protein THITE_2108450 [Thermothielavioides terrestris NRRL 8126]AEO63344.1 hypothetical protein THITE_2108450 [Thermothielavioides terrestris NRRL 8126]
MSQSSEKNAARRSDAPDYKAKLDEAASRAKSPPSSEGQSTGMIDKLSEYVPAVGRMLGGQEKQPETEVSPAGKEMPGPPNRPEHDTQIEEFIRDQHRSKKVVAIDQAKDS